MRLEFDRGTVTLTGCSEREGIDLPGVLWDPRVQVYRAPGFRYAAIKDELNRSGRMFDDQVCAGVDPPLDRWETVEVRPYQAAALSSWELSNARGLLVLPTGSDKTRLALAAMARHRFRTLCLVPTRVLLEQWRTVLERFYHGPIGQYGDGTRALEAITVATFASAFHHMETLGNRFDLLVVDEAHHFGIGAGDEALELCTAPARIGLTGTPPDSHPQRTRLEDLIGPEVYRQSVSDLAGEYLAPLQIVSLRLDLTPAERRERLREPLPCHAPDGKAKLAMHVMDQLCRSGRRASPISPRLARSALFSTAQRSRDQDEPWDRSSIMSSAAARLGVSAEALLESLFAAPTFQGRAAPPRRLRAA